jgi:competence protein ComEC
MKLRHLLVVTFLLFSTSIARAQMSAHYINVGQAESILLEFRTAAILIDAGGEATGDNRDRDHLVAYLNQFFARRTDLNRTLALVIISHPHIDHTKNLRAVIEGFRVRGLLDGGNERGSGIAPLRAARTAMGNRYRAISDARIEASGTTGLRVMPALMASSDVDLRLLASSRGCENYNNDSLVVLVRYRQASFLFDGDSETEPDGLCEGQVPTLIDFYNGTGLLNVDVYKVGHHGSMNATDETFLEVMSPKIAVISAGIHTQRGPGPFHAWQFGHPREFIVSLLEDALSDNRTTINAYTMRAVRRVNNNRRIRKALYCTCWDGDVVVSTNVAGTQFAVARSGR